MNNGISSFHPGRVNPYQQAQQPREAQAASPAQTPQATAAAEAVRTPAGLTRAEQQMINRYFPDSPAMAMRLYGPGRQTQHVNPNAVGSRLDLRG